MGLGYRRIVQTIDSHTEGNATRVIVGGVKTPPGATLLEKRAWLWRNDDALRRMLNFEPRGSGMMCSVRFDTPAGLVICDVAVIDGKVERVSFDNVDSFLLHRNVPLDVEGFGRLVIDVAYGGDFYAFVNADSLRLALDPANDAALISACDWNIRSPNRANPDTADSVRSRAS